MNLMVCIYLVTSVFYIFVGISSYLYDSQSKLNRVFFILCIDLALWALMLTLMNALPEQEPATVFRQIATIFWSLFYCILLHFVLILVKKDKLFSSPLLTVLFYVPALISIYLYLFYIPTSAVNLAKVTFGWVYYNEASEGFFWNSYFPIYCVTYVFICILLIYRWGKKSKLQREKKQAKILFFTISIVVIFGSLTDMILPILKIPLLPPLTVSLIVIPVYGIWYSIKRYRLMNLSPQNVVFDVFRSMQEGLIITDEKNNIKYLNNGALNMLGYTSDELIKKPISLIVDESKIKECSMNNDSELIFEKKDNQSLPVLFSASTFNDEWNEAFGSVITFQDLSEINNIQQELKNSHDELEAKVNERTEELNKANRELRSEIQSRIKMEEKICKLAYFDDLTGLFNKKSFTEYVDKKISENLRNELTLAIMYVDLDSFKLVNDTLGYQLGDKLIVQVAQRLTDNLRISDTTARVGADEFLVLLQNNPDEETIRVIAEKANEAFRQEFIIDGNDVHITASIGVAVYPLDGEDAESLIKNANIAMHRAKEKGKNKYEICNPIMKEKLMETMKLTNQLYRAVTENEFKLYYQPQVDINTGNIVGFESLIRWVHPELGIISPSKFIPIAEKTGLIIPIGEWVLEEACKQMKNWQNSNIVTVPISVNLSAKQLIDYDLIGKVSEVISNTGIEPTYLELEITESVLMEDIDSISETLKQLSKLGVRIAIDDFGTKYSSLNYLTQLPINKVKIDMSFVQGISVNHKDEIIINTIIELAKNLKMSVLAEGVETFRQMDFLKKANCHIVQGFYLYRPMPSKKIENLFNVS